MGKIHFTCQWVGEEISVNYDLIESTHVDFECYYFHYNVYIQGFKMNTNLTNLYMEWVRDNNLENILQINYELGLDVWIFIIIGK